MKTKDKQETRTNDLRNTLKEIVQKELNQLPETLAALPPEKRLEVFIKLLPFALPKVESVSMEKGEPLDWRF